MQKTESTGNLNSRSKLFKENYEQFKILDDQLIQFEKFNNDEDRIDFVSRIFPLDKLPMIEIVKTEKDEEACKKLREQGNEEFGKGNFKAALQFYTKSVLLSPQYPDTIDLALALANRSAVFYHLEDYQTALNDIDVVLRLNYPKELRYKILERKAKSFLGLNNNKDALSAFKSTMQALSDSRVPQQKKKKIEMDVQIMISLLMKSEANSNTKNVIKIENEDKQKVIKQHVNKPKNKVYTAASDSINIQENSIVGRHAVACSDIDVGETVLIEKAYCSVLLEECCKTHCQHCFKRPAGIYPCTNCSSVIFCSLECRDLATYHKYECPILRTLHESGVSVTVLMALRILTQKNLDYFLLLKPRLTDSRNNSETYDSSDYVRVYQLERHENLRKVEDYFERSAMALFLLHCLISGNYFKNSQKDNSRRVLTDEEKFIGGLLLRHLQILQFNAHEISELELVNKENLNNSKTLFIGGGLYPTLALFNHSCDPGIIRYFEGTKIIVRAGKPIAKGEMVAENYGPIYSQMTRDERIQALKKQYWFDCKCICCEEHWPKFDKLDKKTIRFRCDARKNTGGKFQECKNVLLVPMNTENFMIKCSECGQFTNILKGLKVLQDTDIMYKQAFEDANSGKYLLALNIYLEILSMLHKVLAPPFQDYLLCQQSIRQCMLALGNKYVKTSKKEIKEDV